MTKIRKLLLETYPIPIGISLRSKKIPAHIVIKAMDFPTFGGKKCNHFAPNQAA
jgi:hypothetical protein